VTEHGEFSGWISQALTNDAAYAEKQISLRVRHLTQGRERIFFDIR
jgi:hypothetical protein